VCWPWPWPLSRSGLGRIAVPIAGPRTSSGGEGSRRGTGSEEGPGSRRRAQNAEAFAAAFNKGDAKAVAAFWTMNGEYAGPDGEKIRGREVIEKEYADFFKKNSTQGRSTVETGQFVR
jgi:hypothetical protein